MKTKKILILLLFVCIGFATLNETKAQSVNVNVSFSTFQNDLDPYGTWMDNPRFGQVWVYEDPNFKPYYTNGHWEYTSYGWSWVSDFEWGWAPFHYGRWEYDPLYGWMWIPGYEWASAWVSWSSYDDYYGWAPLGYGLGINISFGSIPYDRWNFIPRRNICDRDFYRHRVSHNNNHIFRNAVVINNYYNGREGRFNRGPDRNEVQRHTRTRIVERSTFRGRPQNVAIDHNRTRRNNDQNRVNNGGQRRNENTNGSRERNNNEQRRSEINRQPNANTDQANNRDRRKERANNDEQRKLENNRQRNEDLQRHKNDQQQQMERQRNEQRQNMERQQRNDQQQKMERQRNEQRQNMERQQRNDQQMQRQRNEQRQNMDRQRNEQRQNMERQQRQLNPQREQRQQQPSMERRQENRQPNFNNGNQGRQRNDNNAQRGRGNGKRD